MTAMAGRSSTASQRQARAGRIIAAAARGETTSAIAENERISVRQVRRILASSPAVSAPAELEVRPLLSIDPFAEMAAAVAIHRDVAERLRQIAAGGRNESAAVGAARAAAAVSRDLIALL